MVEAPTEGTFEIMKTRYCDANWAKEHHDLWYDEVKDQASHQAREAGSAQPETSTT